VKRKALAALAAAIVSTTFVLSGAHAQGMNNAQDSEALFRENAPKFHQNFSKGQFEANGPLVTEDIDVDSNNVKLKGRDAFVKRIERYSIPFPGLQLKDRIVVVDGNVAAVNYVLQGENTGPFGKLPPSGNRIEAMSGEVFEFNPQGLMKKLTTITELDRVSAEVKGQIRIGEFQDVTLLPTGKEDAARRAKVRDAAAMFDRNFNADKPDRNGALAAHDITINADNTMLSGRRALVRHFTSLKLSFPDMTIRDEYVLADGNRAAVEYIMEGTQTRPFTLADGSVLPPSGKKVSVRGIEFMEFNEAGLLQDLVIVHNQDDFATQLRQ
jgi:predicted ester cyclase